MSCQSSKRPAGRLCTFPSVRAEMAKPKRRKKRTAAALRNEQADAGRIRSVCFVVFGLKGVISDEVLGKIVKQLL